MSTAAKHSSSVEIATGENPIVGRVLIVDDHAQARLSMAAILEEAGHAVDCLSSGVEAIEKLESQSYDLILTDLNMPGMNGLQFIGHLESISHGAQIVMITAYASVSSAVEAMRLGAFNYIEKPFDVDQLESIVNRALLHGNRLEAVQQLTRPASTGMNVAMIGSSAPMRLLRDRIGQIAPTPETVLITGESGTGKELVARSIHQQSDRRQHSLISLNCPVLSASLMESELFGHEKGAFTGADAARTGRFELAEGGTILLDEVTEIDLSLQAKLLRVLQEREFEKVGSSVTIQSNVRVLSTTNRDLLAEVDNGRFRQDLYYRLAVLPIQVPPLRDRREDLPELTSHFLERSAKRLKKDPAVLTRDAHDLLQQYHWPGNVRELENLITRTSILNSGTRISADQLLPLFLESAEPATQATTDMMPVGLSLQEMERKMIEATLDKFDGHRAKTAKALGIGIRTLSGKLREYGYAPRDKIPRDKTLSKAA